MILERSCFSFVVVASLLLTASCSDARDAESPSVVKALEAKGLKFVQEFSVGGGLRAFAGVAGDQPVAVYVTGDGKAIVGTRVSPSGEPVDEAAIRNLVAKPMDNRAWAQLESATWVLDGKADAPRIVYTFSDPNCPYCNRFWEAARPWVDSGKVQLRHVLVGIIKADSPTKAAAILGASDKSAALLENERNAKQGGIKPAKNVPADIRRILDENQELMVSMGFSGTPGIVIKDGSGVIKKYNGMPRQAVLADVFGGR